MTEQELAVIQAFVLRHTGIVLTAEKRYLVESRLDSVMRTLKIASLSQLSQQLRAPTRELEIAVIDAMTTNETLFFRDRTPFDQFTNIILPKLIVARRSTGKIRIWCAACSSGQEPYSLSMILDDARHQLGGLQVEILATDISEKILSQAREGVYSQFEVQRGLPIKMLLQHFTQQGLRWKINPDLGKRIDFRRLNLTQSLPAIGKFDVVFCRNVLIYFSETTKRDVLARLASAMAPDGFMLLGGAETVLGITDALSPHKDERGMYVHAGSPDAYSSSARLNLRKA
jgi:chemotaxis protein methyltransferase CheR